MVLSSSISALLFLAAPPAPWRAEVFSVANPEGVLSLGGNPAGLAFDQDWEVALETAPKGPEQRSAALVAIGPLAGGWTASPVSRSLLVGTGMPGIPGAREESWHLGLGIPMGRAFSVGVTGLSRELDGVDMGWSADLGALWRPDRHFSIGWHWRNVGESDSLRWAGHGLGIAVRPFASTSLALGWEAWRGGVDASAFRSSTEFSHEFQVSIRPLDWLGIAGRWIPSGEDEVFGWSISGQIAPHARLFARAQPAPGSGSLQGVGIHLGGRRRQDVGTLVPGRVLYRVGPLSGEADNDGLIRSHRGIARVRADLATLGEHREVHTIVLDLGPGRIGVAHAGQLRRSILDLRAQGKVVVGWSQDLTMGSMYALSACTRAAMSPLGTVRTQGLSVRSIYAGSALKRHGIDVEVVRTGPWKSAMEPFIADRMSEEARGDLELWLHDLDSMILGSVAMGRSVAPEVLLPWIDSGSMLPRRARELGLVDTLVEPSELLEWAAPGKPALPLPLAQDHQEQWGPAKEVAILSLEGQIVDGRGSPGMVPWGRNLYADAVVDVLEGLRKDASVGAVVLRVNSPGGSVVGSERIRRAVERLGKEKIVVASFANLAASGAYLFSLPARRTWTEPEGLVGSIGVFTARLSAKRLLDSLGLHVETVSTAPDAGSTSILADLDSSATKRIREQVFEAYHMFGGLVKDARHLDSAAFAQVDGGRVFVGARAVGLGLADEIGSVDEAVEWAGREARLDHPGRRWVSPGSDAWRRLIEGIDAQGTQRPWHQMETLLTAPGLGLWAQLPWELDGP